LIQDVYSEDREEGRQDGCNDIARLVDPTVAVRRMSGGFVNYLSCFEILPEQAVVDSHKYIRRIPRERTIVCCWGLQAHIKFLFAFGPRFCFVTGKERIVAEVS
jgi:hypothetical protein